MASSRGDAAPEVQRSGAATELAGLQTNGAGFEACGEFRGARPGFVFRAGPLGVGYYRDAAASTQQRASERPGLPPDGCSATRAVVKRARDESSDGASGATEAAAPKAARVADDAVTVSRQGDSPAAAVAGGATETPTEGAASGRSSRVVDVSSSLAKLGGFLRADKKVAKAARLFVQLLAARASAANAGEFFDVIAAAMENSERTREKPVREALAQVVGAALARMELFSEEQQGLLQVFALETVCHGKIVATDDTYTFQAALRPLLSYVTGAAAAGQDDESALKLRAGEGALARRGRQAVLYCMDALAECYATKQWARPSVDQFMGEVARRRLLFTEGDERRRVDAHTVAQRERKNNLRGGVALAKATAATVSGLAKPSGSAHPLHRR